MYSILCISFMGGLNYENKITYWKFARDFNMINVLFTQFFLFSLTINQSSVVLSCKDATTNTFLFIKQLLSMMNIFIIVFYHKKTHTHNMERNVCYFFRS